MMKYGQESFSAGNRAFGDNIGIISADRFPYKEA